MNNKIAVVIGGTSGIGRALALGLARAGAHVVASSRSESATHIMSSEIEEIGRRSLAKSVDVCNRSSIDELHETVLGALGPVDILVNCAGITRKIPTLEYTDDMWNEIFEVNLMGTLRACQIFGKSMLERREGRIINIASLSTFVAFHEVAAYGASKAAVGALTQSLAIEWAPFNVLVNAIAPGIFPTTLNSAILDSPRGIELKMRTPMSRFGHADELVAAALYLASPANTFTTGQILTVDGGFMASGVNQ
ncbi:MAG: SDR family oxidoreductase [Acidobacteriaceae bacterium]|nr:SDR family oxidoreductase [Acidobacteriaceae bacterium]